MADLSFPIRRIAVCHATSFGERKELVMADTTIVGDRIEIVDAQNAGLWSALSWSGLSWSGIIAGVFTATAVTFIFIALGSGIGLSLASPFSSSPSAGTLTVLGAVWLVFSQAIGFATGGYVAGRLRREPMPVHTGETNFRDAASGLVVWAIGVVVTSILLAAAVEKVGSAAATTATVGAAAAGVTGASNQSSSIDYFTDTLLRTNPQAPSAAGGATAGGASPGGASPGGAPAAAATPDDRAMHAQVGRILITAVAANGIAPDDRTYLAQIVSARTGMSMEDAQKRVDDVVNRARASVTQAAETARKAGAYLSFWTFMSLLFGAACATLGGMLGGDLRDDFTTRRAVPTAPR
jgi:hypothetical protein